MKPFVTKPVEIRDIVDCQKRVFDKAMLTAEVVLLALKVEREYIDCPAIVRGLAVQCAVVGFVFTTVQKRQSDHMARMRRAMGMHLKPPLLVYKNGSWVPPEKE